MYIYGSGPTGPNPTGVVQVLNIIFCNLACQINTADLASSVKCNYWVWSMKLFGASKQRQQAQARVLNLSKQTNKPVPTKEQASCTTSLLLHRKAYICMQFARGFSFYYMHICDGWKGRERQKRPSPRILTFLRVTVFCSSLFNLILLTCLQRSFTKNSPKLAKWVLFLPR